jgi:hypothetical protein
MEQFPVVYVVSNSFQLPREQPKQVVADIQSPPASLSYFTALAIVFMTTPDLKSFASLSRKQPSIVSRVRKCVFFSLKQ